jgi:hypothetical protein
VIHAVRKRRGKTVLGRQADWEVLYGDEDGLGASNSAARWNPDANPLKESSQNPLFSRKDTRDLFQWRIRNLPYPQDTYSINVEAESNKIVIRTSNKKYFKRFEVPEMDRLKLPLNEGALTWYHGNNTLVVSYAKPGVVMQAEAKEYEETRKIRPQEGDVDCKQQ